MHSFCFIKTPHKIRFHIHANAVFLDYEGEMKQILKTFPTYIVYVSSKRMLQILMSVGKENS